MERPELKQFGDLLPEDFERHPVWVQCHTFDYDEDWYDDTDEETFRPWTQPLPVDPSDGMFLVYVTFRLPDGTQFPGFATPATEPDDMGSMQPQMFVNRLRFAFWGGMFGVPEEKRQSLYSLLGKGAPQVFPLSFAGDPSLALGNCTGQVNGFYRLVEDGVLAEP